MKYDNLCIMRDSTVAPLQIGIIDTTCVLDSVPIGDWWENNKRICLPTYYTTTVLHTEDKMEKAFKITKQLMENKLISLRTIKQFIEFIEVISKEL